MKKKIVRKRKILEVAKECSFCKEGKNPDFLDADALQRFTSERGKIFSRSRSGVCSKHQRKLTTAIKRARFIALMPFVLKAE